MVPVAGSAYTYAYATVGELFAWIIGWDLILEYALSVATVAVGWSGYFVSFARDLGIIDSRGAGGATRRRAGVFNLPAAVIVLVVSALLVIGIKQSADTNTLLVGDQVGGARRVRRRPARPTSNRDEPDAVHPAEHRRLRSASAGAASCAARA